MGKTKAKEDRKEYIKTLIEILKGLDK